MNSWKEKKIRARYEKITKTLVARGLTITTMESCTAGQITSLLTDTEGSSAILKGAFVTYSNEAKIMQGVPAETITKYGVYSEETAQAMAAACRKAYRADIGIGITGTMGNTDPANGDSVPGEVFLAVSADGLLCSRREMLPVQETRLAWKLAAAEYVADLLEETFPSVFQ